MPTRLTFIAQLHPDGLRFVMSDIPGPSKLVRRVEAFAAEVGIEYTKITTKRATEQEIHAGGFTPLPPLGGK